MLGQNLFILTFLLIPVYCMAFSRAIDHSRKSTAHEIMTSMKTTDNYKLRLYNPTTDRSALDEICANVYGGSDYLPKVADTYVADPMCSFLALEQNGIIVAVANYKRLPLQNSVWIEAVRTHPNHRNKGLATSLLRELVSLSREEGISNVTILTCTIESNIGMQRAFEKVGFRACNHIHTLSFAALKQLPGWEAGCASDQQPLLTALDLDHLVSSEARSIDTTRWNTVSSENELLIALEQCKSHGGTCGYLPGLYEYIVPSPSRTDLRKSINHGLVFTWNIVLDKEISSCDHDNDSLMKIEKAILVFTKDERISSLKSQWVCSIVAYTKLAFEAAMVHAHSSEVAKRLQSLESTDENGIHHPEIHMQPFCLVFDGAVPLDDGTLAHALPRVTDQCVVFSYA